MIALLLNSTFWIILGTVVFTALVIYFCHKSQVFAHIAKIAGIFLGVALLGGSAIYSVYQVNGYYSAEGGIIGKITNTFKPNVVNVNDFEIKIDNIELQQEFEDTYLAEITINQEIKLDSNKKYALFVNGAPTSCFASESNYIGGVYGYAFYGSNNTLLLHDDLVLELAIHKNYSLMYIYTNGGNTAVNYWNYYFNRNDFVVTIEEIDVAAINNNEEITGVIPEYYTVSYCVEDEVVAKQIYHPNDTIELTIEDPEAPEDYHAFSGWTVNDSTIDETFRVTGNTLLKATFAFQAGVYDENKKLVYSIEDLIDDGFLTIEDSYGNVTLKNGSAGLNSNITGELVVPEGITSLYQTLELLNGITSLKLSSTVKDIRTLADSAVDGLSVYSLREIELNEGLEVINDHSFCGFTSLVEVVIPSSVTRIDGSAFENCSSLKRIEFKNNSSLTYLGSSVFSGCSQLEEIEIPNGVSRIANWTFYRCTKLSNVVLPTSDCSIRQNAFVGSGLNEIWISKDLDVRTGAFDNILIYTDATTYPSSWGQNISSNMSINYSYTYEQYLAVINN